MNYLTDYNSTYKDISHYSLVNLCLYLTMFFLPLKRFASLGWFDLPKHITCAKIFIVLTFLFWLARMIFNKESSLILSPFRRVIYTAVILYLTVSIFSILNATVAGAALTTIARRGVIIVLFFLIIDIIRNEKTLRNAIIAFILGNVLHPMAGIYELLTQKPIINTDKIIDPVFWRKETLFEEAGGIRIQGLATDPDYQAYILVMAIGIVLATIFNSYIVRSRITRCFLFVLFILLMSNVFLASSRIGWIGIFITLSIFVLFVHTKHKKLLIIGMLVLTSTTFTALAFFSNTPMLTRLRGSGGVFSINYRVADAKVALSMFRSHPVLGVGTGNVVIVRHKWRKVAPEFFEKEEIPSFTNGYLQILAENGLVGFSVYLLVILSFIVSLLRLITSSPNIWKRTMALGLLSSFFGHLIMLMGYNLHDSEIAWMMMGLGMALFQFHEVEMKEMSKDRLSSWMGTVPFPQKKVDGGNMIAKGEGE